MNTPEYIVYDRVFIGGGLASLFAAYVTLREAKAADRKLDVLVVAQEIKAPVTAGSHWVQQAEGMMAGPDNVANFEMIREMLKSARDDLANAIAAEKIECRFIAGYEIKAKTEKELLDFVDGIASNGVSRRGEVAVNSAHQVFRLAGYDHSVTLDSIGQVNSPELLNGIVTAIEQLGGHVLIGATYETHRPQSGGERTVETSGGTFRTRHNPFLGVGALNARSLPDYHFGGRIAYTGAIVIGPLSDNDARKIADRPMAICDVNVNDDVFWGGLDPENMLTVGQGDLENANDIPALAERLAEIAERILPDVTKNYPSVLSTGPMLITDNAMPVAGRMKNYDIATGWAGLGIVPAFAAAKAFAAWYVHGDDGNLRIFEAMQPAGFTGAPAPKP